MVALSSSIRAVTLYARGARVTRAALLSGRENGRIRITGLPLALDDRSLHVRIEAAERERPTPVATSVRVTLEVPDQDDDLAPAIADDLVAVRREEAQLHDLIGQVQRELGRLDRLGLVPRPKPLDGSQPAGSPFEARLALIELRGVRADALAVEMRELKVKLHEVQRRRQELEDRERRRSSARSVREHELRKTAVVTLDHSVGSADGTLILEYLVPGARWAPTYALRLERGGGRAELAMRAVIAQNSGEDWSDVELTLSTADAHKFTALPELTSVRIGPQKHKPGKIGWRPAPSGTEDLFEGYDAVFGMGAARAPEQRAGSFEAELDDTDDFVEEHLETTPYMEAVTREHDLSAYADHLAEDDEATASEATLAADEPARKPRGRARRDRERAARPTQSMVESESFGAPPPPAPAPTSAPMAAAAPARFSRADAMAKRAAPAEASGTITRTAISESRSITASIELLDYGSMTMPPPRQPERGRLMPEDTADRYLELLRERGIEVEFDPIRTVTEAIYQAREVEFRDPPAGCTFAWSDRFDYAYRSAARVSIPSDGRFHSVPVRAGEGRAFIRHVCVPRESTDVFRLAEVENPLDAPLLAGPADVYIGSDYVVTTALPVTPSGAAIHLGLGVEQSVKVARNTRYGEDSAGILGGSRSLRHEILIEAENLLERVIELEVRERIPVVREDEEDIKVEVGKVSPPWSSYRPEIEDPGEAAVRGAHRWSIEVPARDKRELRVHYEIKISSKNELIGGNRRE